MNSKERVLAAINGGKPDLVPAFPHWWGVYKLDILGMDPRLFPTLGGKRLADIDINFYETFKPDVFHLGGGADHEVQSQVVVRDGDDWHLLDETTGKRRRLLADWTIESPERGSTRLTLTSRQEIDEYLARRHLSAAQIVASGTYDHVAEIVGRYGDEVFVAMNLGSPVCNIFGPDGPVGYEEALIALREKREMLSYLIERSYHAYFEHAKALAMIGCHALITSEAYVASDTISPALFEQVIYPVYKAFNQDVGRLGLVPIIYFMGNINPLLPLLRNVGIRCLMVEEPKKGFDVDVIAIKRALGEDVCLVGNVDSVEVMLRGSASDVARAVQAQLPAARDGGFIASTGSPLTVDTPQENVHAFMCAARVAV
ncbi:MAG: uroporphyrinogen decarboxylase family protein [Anaerolineae bacterium]